MRAASAFLATVVLASMYADAASQPGGPEAQRFVRAYQQQLETIRETEADMVVEELRLRVEQIVSRGSAVAGTSNFRRVRGFEATLLQSLQRQLCPAGLPLWSVPPTPSRDVVSAVQRAAAAQNLRTEDNDVAELTALTERVIRSQTPVRWCALSSLDEVR